ncbi:MAG: hypothetical protein IJ043_03170 [Clostridia bacterium]|nr:hypothetical protein [Clostridia bacterium]
MVSPCYKCGDRRIGCHAKCERYLVWSAAHQEKREAIRAAKAEDGRFREYIVKRSRRKKR